jgi:hypothetical protein
VNVTGPLTSTFCAEASARPGGSTSVLMKYLVPFWPPDETVADRANHVHGAATCIPPTCRDLAIVRHGYSTSRQCRQMTGFLGRSGAPVETLPERAKLSPRAPEKGEWTVRVRVGAFCQLSQERAVEFVKAVKA